VADKLAWKGWIVSVQPRIRLTRSFDERAHTYMGYLLRIDGVIGDEERTFLVGIGKAAYRKHEFRAGDAASGMSEPVPNPAMESAEFYKASKLKVENRGTGQTDDGPWLSIAPELETYRKRGHRRLSAKTFDTKCHRCVWGCRMPVEIIVDHWKPNVKRYRFETFCYGPKSCAFYKTGPERKVPGRKGMTFVEEDWIDEQDTAERGPDD